MKTNNSLDILKPSGIGWVMYVTMAGLLMVLHQFASIQQYLELPRNIEFARTVKLWLEQLLYNTLGDSWTETVVVGFFWAAVGLAVYVFLQGLAKTVFEFGQSINQRHYVWPQGTNRNQPIVQIIKRTLFQGVAAVLALVWFMQPLARVLDGPVMVGTLGPNIILQYLVWTLAIVLSLHILVILLRLVVLRRRLIDR